MGFGMLMAGLILLFNPVIIVVDVLPDAVAFFLIAAGLTKMSYFIGKIAQARDAFLKLALVEVAKFVSILVLPYASGSADVLLAFVFGLIEGFLFVPAVNYLFEGLSFAGLWYSGTAVYAKRRGPGGREIEAAAATKRFMIFFYILRIVSTLVPELTELEMYDYIGTVDSRILRMTYFKPLLYILFTALVLVFGVIYIVRVVRFFNPIRKDTPFIDALRRKFERDILPKTSFFIAKTMKIVLLLFGFSVGTSFLVFIEDVNILIGAVSSGILIAAAVILCRYVKQAWMVIATAAVRAGLSVWNFLKQLSFSTDYTVDAVPRVTEAYHRYYRMAMTQTVEYLFALASVLLFIVFLMRAVKQHLEVSGIRTDTAQYSKRNRDLETYNTIGGKLLLTSVLAFINTVMACAYPYLAVNMPFALLLVTAVTLIYAIYTIYALSVVDNLLYDKEIEMA